ncbi:MAG: aldo/keto reductase [Alistipes sp.]|nr:aldo/keto reductase [Alistipes sp.]
MKVNKLVLGTVQFGCQYGINSVGQPNVQMVSEILDVANNVGVTILDTSAAYGNAEEVLGEVNASNIFQIISKYPKCNKTVRDTLDDSLKSLGCSKLYGYLLHHFSVYTENKTVWNDFIQLKVDGKVEKIGFSLYEPYELDMILNDDIPFDLIQIPFNIFDRQFESYFGRLKQMNVEIHVRSTFLQGLFFKDRDTLPEKLLPLKPYLKRLDEYAKDTGLSVAEIALNYNIQNPYIDGVLIGVDTKDQLQTNFKSVSDKRVDLSIDVKETELLKPVNWN